MGTTICSQVPYTRLFSISWLCFCAVIFFRPHFKQREKKNSTHGKIGGGGCLVLRSVTCIQPGLSRMVFVACSFEVTSPLPHCTKPLTKHSFSKQCCGRSVRHVCKLYARAIYLSRECLSASNYVSQYIANKPETVKWIQVFCGWDVVSWLEQHRLGSSFLLNPSSYCMDL